jgi:putative hydrolase of the HAD superfamily
MKKKYTSLLFDLFNTVALWDTNKIPIYKIGGKERHSTLGELKLVLSDHLPGLNFDDFHDAFDAVNRELTKEKRTNRKEVSSRQRFLRILRKLDIQSSLSVSNLANDLSQTHMQLLISAAFVPEEHRNLITILRSTHKLGIVSNFDHAESAKSILARDGVASYFHQIIISDEVGWRKPDSRIFDLAVQSTEDNKENILFIGDSIADDIIGASEFGLDVAWVNPKGQSLNPDIPKPTYEIKSILELKDLLYLKV